jgi:predicted Rossmann fold flavoprotein
MSLHDVLIIGAGPAGLFAAIRAAEAQRSVLVLEKQPEPGRKLLLTGSGQCNFTHAGPIRDFLSAYGEHDRFLKPALFHFSNRSAVDFFEGRGVKTMTVEETGKIFPASRRAADILQALLSACREGGVEIRCRQSVAGLTLDAPREFRVRTASDDFFARSVILAVGGQSYPATGSTGDGYRLAASLGHTVVPPRPGLTPFFIQDFPLASLTGISFKNLAVTLWRGEKKIKTLVGDLLITHHGVSGPVVHNLARYAELGDTATLAFAAGEDLESFRKTGMPDADPNGNLRTWLKQFGLPQSLQLKILRLAQIPSEIPAAQLSRDKRLALVRLLGAFPLKISSLGDFKVAMVTCGGVALDEINPKTMESRMVPGLYFAGEVMDIDGDSGGYDLQAAWSTGSLAGVSAGGKTPPG